MISDCTDGDWNEQFAMLYRKHFSSLVGYLMNRFHSLSREQALDIAQDTFVSVYEHVTPPIPHEWPLLVVIARHKALNVVNRDRLPGAVPIEAVRKVASQAPGPDVDAQASEERARLAAAIEELPAGTKHCLLFRLAGFKYREIAEQMHITLDAVKARLQYAIRLLREHLGQDPSFDSNGDDDD